MRLKLNLRITSKSRELHLNYQYAVSSWIYKTLNLSNPDFATWLHEHGYQLDNKKFKLFCFSNLMFHQAKISNDNIISLSDSCSVILSFYVPETLHHFVHGCFMNQKFSLICKDTRMDFQVQSIEVLPPPKFSENMHFKTLTPVCISQLREYQNKMSCVYLSPLDEAYVSLLAKNTLEKYQSFTHKTLNHQTLSFSLTAEPTSKLTAIYKDKSNPVFIRAYHFRFEVKAQPELMKTIYYAGLGEKNSMGFGLIQEINSV